MHSFAKKMVATHAQIQEAIVKVANKIANDPIYKDLTVENPLVLICVLKGSYLFTADLARALFDAGVPNIVEFICVSSYGKNTTSSGEVRMLLDLRNSIRGRHCLIVEDIIDSARTLKFLTSIYELRSPKTLRTIALLDKPAGRVMKFDVDYSCFMIENEFVAGYGLDYQERFRDLRDIVVLKPEVYNKKVAAERHSVHKVPSKL